MAWWGRATIYLFSILRKDMKKFLLAILYFLIPFIFILVVYVCLDPFKVIKSYETLIDDKAKGWVGLNKDFISTTTFDKNYEQENYNSFIFGNSRSVFYQISDWKKYITDYSHCFHFDASGEILRSLVKKIQYVDDKGLEIDNVLLIVDYATLSINKPKSGHMFITSPQLLNYSNVLDFHFTFFKAFLSPRFLYAFFDFKITGEVKAYMRDGHLLDNRLRNYDKVTNEVRYDYFEKLISDEQYYTTKRLSVFYERDTIQKYSPISIKENQKTMFKTIYDIFNKHKTNYKIVISPLYDQIKLNPQDIAYLKEIFGENSVFDYSGINALTQDYRNYYENAHYRPRAARIIINEIYNGK